MTAPIDIAASGTATGGKITPDTTSGGNLELGNDISLRSPKDISLFGYRDVVIDQGANQGKGVTIEAGILAPGTSTTTNIPPDKILSKGSIYVRSGTRDIVTKRGTSLTAVGKDVVLQSGRDLNLEGGTKVISYGGNVGLFTDSGHILVENDSLLKAVGTKTPPNCPGGGVYVWTEVPGITIDQAVAAVNPIWGTFFQQGSVKNVHSIFSPPSPASMGYIEAISAQGPPDHIEAHHSGFYTYGSDVRGGIISIRTPGYPSSQNVIFQKSNVIAINDCGKKPEPPIPPTPVNPKPVVVPNPVTEQKVVTAPVYTLTIETPKLTTSPDYVWTVTYAPESYLEATSRAKIVVIGGKYISTDASGTNLLVAGQEVRVAEQGQGGVAQTAIVIRDSAEVADTKCGVIALGGAAQSPMLIKVGGQSYVLYPGAALFVSQARDHKLGEVACIRPVTTSAASLEDPIPRSLLLHTKEVPLRNELHYTLEKQEKLAEQQHQRPVAGIVSTSGVPLLDFPGFCLVRNGDIHKLEGGRYGLTRGSLLASVTAPTRIDTPHGSVFADHGAVLMISTSDRITRVRNFSDHHEQSVKVLIGDKQVTLLQGKELNVTNLKDVEFMPMVLSDGLARRDLKQTQNGNAKVIVADSRNRYLPSCAIQSTSRPIKLWTRLSKRQRH